MARIGKIARLPAEVREELNKRLRGGALGPQLLPWLNALPEAQAVVAEFFGGQAINAQNLSDWRMGGFAEWEEKQDKHYGRLERIRELSAVSMKLAAANGGNLSEGASSILGGTILEVLEQVDELRESIKVGDDEPERFASLTEAIDGMAGAVARLRKGDHDRSMLELNRQRLVQAEKALALDREKFERIVCEKLLDAANLDKAREIAGSGMSNADKIAALRQAYFADVDELEKSGEVKLPE